MPAVWSVARNAGANTTFVIVRGNPFLANSSDFSAFQTTSVAGQTR
jgi:hypothetical protein